MHHLQANQFTLNSFQRGKSEGKLRRYLLQILRNSNNFINLWVDNLTCLSPVHRIFSSLNIVFILAILALSTFGVRTWMYPKYPSKVDGVNQLGSSRELAPLAIARPTLPLKSVNEMVSKNLFRKERDEYRPPAPPPSTTQVAQATPRPALPPPELTLRGVMLLNGIKIAVLEGSYPVMKGNKTENNPIKRKGYYLGDQIGNYKIAQIGKREVTLRTPSGRTLPVKLIRRIPSMDKAPKNKPRESKFTSTRPIVKKRPQPAPRISGSGMTPLPKHISGR